MLALLFRRRSADRRRAEDVRDAFECLRNHRHQKMTRVDRRWEIVFNDTDTGVSATDRGFSRLILCAQGEGQIASCVDGMLM
jgi:hypothetical protein